MARKHRKPRRNRFAVVLRNPLAIVRRPLAAARRSPLALALNLLAASIVVAAIAFIATYLHHRAG
jgi:hypothetical protein